MNTSTVSSASQPVFTLGFTATVYRRLSDAKSSVERDDLLVVLKCEIPSGELDGVCRAVSVYVDVQALGFRIVSRLDLYRDELSAYRVCLRHSWVWYSRYSCCFALIIYIFS